MEENTKKKLSKKTIWIIVAILALAVVITASAYISHIKKNTPTEDQNVIALIPEDSANIVDTTEGDDTAPTAPKTGETESADDEDTVQIETPKSTLRNGATTYTLQSGKRQVGLQEAEMIVEDKQKVWKSETKVDIFDKEYYGTGDQITVANNSDDWNLIAPGTEKSYRFWLKNTGEVGINYTVSFEEHSRPYDLPLEVRVRCGSHYILGDSTTWEPIKKLDKTVHEGRLHVKNYAQYTLEWRWPFEEDDVRDTALGDEAVNRILEQEIIIHTYGEGYDRPIYETVNILSPKTGDAANVILWAGVAVCALFVIIFVKKRKDEKEDANEEK